MWVVLQSSSLIWWLNVCLSQVQALSAHICIAEVSLSKSLKQGCCPVAEPAQGSPAWRRARKTEFPHGDAIWSSCEKILFVLFILVVVVVLFFSPPQTRGRCPPLQPPQGCITRPVSWPAWFSSHNHKSLLRWCSYRTAAWLWMLISRARLACAECDLVSL